MIPFTFSDDEWDAATAEGIRRQHYARQHGARGNNFAGNEGTTHTDLIGAAGEMAVASFLGLKRHLYGALTPIRESFDLPGIDVKTRSRHHWPLMVHANERIDHKTFWLVTIEDGDTRIQGWISGKDCKQERWLKPHKLQPCYFVPTAALHDPLSWPSLERKLPWIFAQNEFGF